MLASGTADSPPKRNIIVTPQNETYKGTRSPVPQTLISLVIPQRSIPHRGVECGGTCF
jgi:hypothetical protein